MEIKFKKLVEHAILPSYAKPGDAGLDIIATDREAKWENGILRYIEYSTGIAVEIPPGYVGLLFARSSITNKPLTLKNSVGILDSGYRGEIKFRFAASSTKMEDVFENAYFPEDKIGQLVILPHPKIEPVLVDELSDSERGDGGFGSTGR